MQKRFFKKRYFDRDFAYIMDEAWYRSHEQDLKKYLGIENPYVPSRIFSTNDGLISVWEDEQADHWIKDTILAKNTENPEWFKSVLGEYSRRLAVLEKAWSTDGLMLLEELKEYVALLISTTTWFIPFYYTASDTRNTKEVYELALAAREADSFYDSCDAVVRKSLRNIFPHLDKYSLMLFADELENPPTMSVLKARWEQCVFIPNSYVAHETMEQFALKHPEFEVELEYESATYQTQIKGQVAYPGNARGVVRIVKHKDEVGLFQEGEILVASMTTPVFVPAMKKAAAIVTDEGGLLCHAAILARELGKPCVIGTKIATKSLNDGDLVEVDAHQGTVRIV